MEKILVRKKYNPSLGLEPTAWYILVKLITDRASWLVDMYGCQRGLRLWVPELKLNPLLGKMGSSVTASNSTPKTERTTTKYKKESNI